ncbi:MAG TPA: 30S ribosomal protein S20 [Patescibacteria group bacterium]|nr:30S ribosomal protein S20 [Patescibacteria group bacterium]
MPIKKSAAKALKRSEKVRNRHKKRKARIKFLRRVFLKNIKENNKKQAKNIFLKLQKAIDKAVQTGAIKKNNGSRKKSRFAKKLHGLD